MEWSPDVAYILQQAIAPSTRGVYTVGYNTYCRYLSLLNLKWSLMPPVSEQLLIQFAAHCHQQLKLHYSTIKLYLCGVRYFFLSSTTTCPVYSGSANLARLQLVLNGI